MLIITRRVIIGIVWLSNKDTNIVLARIATLSCIFYMGTCRDAPDVACCSTRYRTSSGTGLQGARPCCFMVKYGSGPLDITQARLVRAYSMSCVPHKKCKLEQIVYCLILGKTCAAQHLSIVHSASACV
jgi:hypothetical protein